jgi:hypothetical protein
MSAPRRELSDLRWFAWRCWWFRRHRWRTLWEMRTQMPWGYVCLRCGRQTNDLTAPLKQGQMKGWMLP